MLIYKLKCPLLPKLGINHLKDIIVASNADLDIHSL